MIWTPRDAGISRRGFLRRAGFTLFTLCLGDSEAEAAAREVWEEYFERVSREDRFWKRILRPEPVMTLVNPVITSVGVEPKTAGEFVPTFSLLPSLIPFPDHSGKIIPT